MNEQNFSDRLRAFRKAKGLTQQQLADLLHISNKSVSRWESDGGYPDVELLLPLAQALGVTVDALLSDTPPQRLTPFDWQNLLSFAFAVGGGVLFYLIKLFTPTLLAYAIYLGAMGYGVHLQSRYTFRSDWFYRFHLLTNFTVNLSLLGALPWIGSALAGVPNLLTTLYWTLFYHTDNSASIDTLLHSLLTFCGWLLLWVVLALALSALTLRFLRKKLDRDAPKNLWRCIFGAKTAASEPTTAAEE